MTRPSPTYLAALADVLGAETFGDSTARKAGALLIAQLAGADVEAQWRNLRADVRYDSARSLLMEIRDRWLPVALRISEARTLSNREPAPTGLDPLADLCRAELALDHAMGRLKAYPIGPPGLAERVAAEVLRIGELIRDLAASRAEEGGAED